MAEKKQKIAPRYGSLKVSPEERLRIDALELRLKQERGGRPSLRLRLLSIF